MSRDSSNNLRLLGSPVNLTYRAKKRDEKKQIRNRPKSALNSSSFHMENPDRYKRPFSADAKGNQPVTRNFLNSFSADLRQSYDETAHTLKIYPPTSNFLEHDDHESQTTLPDKEICSNASDYGSEDTFISLGTKIKAKAQLTPKSKNSNKNMAKYKAMRKQRKSGDHEEKPVSSEYNFDVKITEKPDKNIYQPRSSSPSLKNRAYDSYFIRFDNAKEKEDSLVGRVSFASGPSNNDIEKAIDSYSKILNQTKQQLSLVEEENTQDIDSLPSQNFSSLSPENSIEDNRVNKTGPLTNNNGKQDEESDKDSNIKINTILIPGPKTYSSFYDDVQPYSISAYEPKASNTHTDSSSKDSGYIEDKVNTRRKTNSISNTSNRIERTKSNDSALKEQPKSLGSIPLTGKNEESKVSSEWPEPINHSRLLFKDFFLQKEGYKAIPPNNSPTEKDKPITKDVPKANDARGMEEYPTYLLNSNTKAYTSQVIEDYKKEIAAINNLHELTIKDIKTDTISPTPFHIDKMFEVDDKATSSLDENYLCNNNNIPFQTCTSPIVATCSTSIEKTENTNDIFKKSTKELIDDYFKVKQDYSNDCFTKPKTRDRNIHSASGLYESTRDSKKTMNNKGIIKNPTPKMSLPLQLKNQLPSTSILKTPLSARLESVQHDKDIDSWMSLSEPLPKNLDYEDSIERDKEEMNCSFNQNKSRDEKTQEGNIACSSPLPESRNVKTPTKDLDPNSTVLDIYSMLKEIESYGEAPVTSVADNEELVKPTITNEVCPEERNGPNDNFVEIFEFLEKVEQSANDALSVVTTALPPNIPKLDQLLKLPQTELAQRLVTASLQLEERSCCISLLQESLANHKEQMVQKVNNLEKQSQRNIHRVKQECEEAIKRHQNFIDQLINDKKTLNHRIEQLVDERRSLEERWRRSAQTLEERYKLELRNQHDKMAAAQQVARQRWVRQKAEKIKELTVKGLEGELREMAERQQQEVADLKMSHAEQIGRMQAKLQNEMQELRSTLEREKEEALVKERMMAANRMEKQILELELTYQEQRTRLVAEMRAENERVANGLTERENNQRKEIEQWKDEQEKLLDEKRAKLQQDIMKEREQLEEELSKRRAALDQQFESHKRDFESEQQVILKRKVTEIAAQHKMERDREIERAIESMEAEAQRGRRELQDAMRRNKEQYELELKELAETEQATLRRYQEAQARVRHTEDRCAELEVSISQLETRNKILVEKNAQLEKSADEIRTACNEAWSGKIDKMKKDMDEMKKTHDEQMHQLYAKVKIAVARKDSAIQALTRESAKQQEKITILEQKLQQQRKDFLKHK